MTAAQALADDPAFEGVRRALALCRSLTHPSPDAEPSPPGGAPEDAAEDPSAPVTMAPPHELQALQAALAQASQALSAAGQAMPARVVGTCAAAASRLGEVPLALARQAAVAIERALQEVLQPPAGASPGSVEWALVMFAAYSAVAHLAGAQRVHPAELWPARPAAALQALRDGHVSPSGLASPREPTHSLLAEFEEALLALMRQPGAAAHARMTQLCADLAAGQAFSGSAVWPLAAAVYEAQRDELVKTDVQLKRLGSRLLSMLRAAAGYGPAMPAQQVSELEHEMCFACARALWRPAASDAAPGPWLRAVDQALDLQPPTALSNAPSRASLNAPLSAPSSALSSAPPSAAHAGSASPTPSMAAGLAQRVVGLPSMADLDPSTWNPAAPAPADDSVRLIGPLRLDIEPLNHFLNEADERSRRLQMQLSEWVLESQEGVVHPPAQAGLDTGWLAERSAQLGHADLAQFAAAMGEAIAHLQLQPLMDPLLRGAQARILDAAARELDRVLHQFAAGFLKPASAQVFESLRGLCTAPTVHRPSQAVRDAAQAVGALALLWRNARQQGIASADEATLVAIDTALEHALLRAEAACSTLGPDSAPPNPLAPLRQA